MRSALCSFAVLTLYAGSATAQYPPGFQGSSNMTVVAHIPTGGSFHANDLEIEQELSRPYVYVSRRGTYGFSIVDVRDPPEAKLLYTWVIEDPTGHQGRALDNKYFKVGRRYYDVQSFQFRSSGPDGDLGAIVFDVTGLPDTSGIREMGRIRAPDTPGGFHNIFMYKHSDGRALLFATVSASPTTPHGANIYDMGRFLAGEPNGGLISRMPLPEPRGARGGYHDIYVGYDPSTRQDRFYGGGPEVTMLGGYYVYDVTRVEEPKLLASMVGVAGQTGAHTFVPTPDGRYALTASPVTQSPIRVFDLEPALTGRVENVTRPIGAWAADWRNLAHNVEMRWPYAFISGYEDGVHVVNVMDPTNPYTVAYYDTYDGPHEWGPRGTIFNGSFGIDVRNADGLIVTADMTTGFWALRMDGFDGWNGHQWGMPNISSVQDWDRGPDGAPGKVS